MKKLLAILLSCLFLVSAFAGCGSGKTGGKLVVGLDDQFPPMGFRDENNELVGFDIDLAKKVGERLGMEVVLQPINWAAKEMELDAGNVDVLWNGMTITDARKESMLVSEPYLKNAQIIVVKADSPINSKADMGGITVALQTGSSAEEAFDKDEIKSTVAQVVQMDDNVAALNDLEIGRVDAVVIDKIVAEYYLTKKPGIYKILADELAPEEFGIAFKKGNKPLHDKVVGELKKMAKDGTATEISMKWFGEDRFILK